MSIDQTWISDLFEEFSNILMKKNELNLQCFLT